MKALWITNCMTLSACKAFDFPPAQSGSWIEATAEKIKRNGNVKLAIATTDCVSKILYKEYEDVLYYCIPGGKAVRGKRAPARNKELWKKVLAQFQPDVIRIWGTEFTTGLDIMDVACCPIEIRLQGVVRAIDKYPNGGLRLREMTRGQPLDVRLLMTAKYYLDVIRFHKQVKFEKEMVSRAETIIADNDWALSQFCGEYIGKVCRIERMPLKNDFFSFEWSCQSYEPYTIFCTAGRTGYKGIHQLIKAVSIVKELYPDIKVYIPGNMGIAGGEYSKKIPYAFYIKNLINQYNLHNNIEFTGYLSSYQMAEYLKRSNVYVMPSAIENESSSLREAMSVGCPCISANVGDVSEVITDGISGFLYRYEEYEVLADRIIKVFQNEDLAKKLSDNGKRSITEFYGMPAV